MMIRLNPKSSNKLLNFWMCFYGLWIVKILVFSNLWVRVCSVTNLLYEKNVYRLSDDVRVSGTSLWCARKIDGLVCYITSLTYSQNTGCNDRAMNWHRVCVTNRWNEIVHTYSSDVTAIAWRLWRENLIYRLSRCLYVICRYYYGS